MGVGFEKNVILGPPVAVSGWRKTSVGTYAMTGDCQVYCLQTINVGPALDFIKARENGLSLTHLAAKAAGLVMRDNPEINRMLKFGRFYPRKEVSIFFQVAMDNLGKDLSGHTIRNVDVLSLEEIQAEMKSAVYRMRGGDDFNYKEAKRILGKVPSLLLRPFISLYGFILYGLNIWAPFFGAPKDCFGSMMITNVGNLGLQTAFAPLVPYSHCPLILSLGAVYEKVVAENGKVIVQKSLDCCWTLDHRLIDGVVGAKMSKEFQFWMENPQGLDS